MSSHNQKTQPQIPLFEPLPPTNILNRIINKVLAPLFYLLFTIVTAIIVVPVYTIVENYKKGRKSKSGVHRNEGSKKQQGRNRAKEFLDEYSKTSSRA